MKQEAVDAAFIASMRRFFKQAVIRKKSGRNWCSQGLTGRQISIDITLNNEICVETARTLFEKWTHLEIPIAGYFVAGHCLDNIRENRNGQIFLNVTALILTD